VGGQGEGFWGEGELLGVVEAEEGVGDGGGGVVDDLDGLLSLPTELHHLRLDADQV
jgi:hypothetical protein